MLLYILMCVSIFPFIFSLPAIFEHRNWCFCPLTGNGFVFFSSHLRVVIGLYCATCLTTCKYIYCCLTIYSFYIFHIHLKLENKLWSLFLLSQKQHLYYGRVARIFQFFNIPGSDYQLSCYFYRTLSYQAWSHTVRNTLPLWNEKTLFICTARTSDIYRKKWNCHSLKLSI